MQNIKKRWMGLTAVLLLCMTAAGCGSSGGAVNVTTAKVKTDSALSETAYTGTVKARSMQEITADVSGKVASVEVKEGQNVRAGDVLFRLDETEYELQAKQAEAVLSAAQVALSSARSSQSADAAVIPARTASADAHANYDRMKQLYDAGGISEADFEAARSKMETADAQLAAAQISQNSASDNAAAQVESARAAYELAAQRLADCTVKAPIDGQVSQIKIESGSVVSAQTAAMTVVDNSSLKVAVEVLEKDVKRIAEGMEAQVTVQSLGQTCKASVHEIAPSADEQTGMFQVTVVFDPADSGVLSGMAADVRLTDRNAGADGTGAAALYVPEKSIVKEDGKSFVYVVGDGRVSKREVRTGLRKNQYIEVEDGLAEGDEVVVQAGGDLEDGARVAVIKS
ncbi:efflux RND transporter periplasmic adaptor subunit [Bacilliculturomica massiliensis]|uniref:efflux RND transporter periplasmic adaptor subunit n=1 Tax=Bacilliculturomica massiliensis TaxID=1917867 RepID=UPI0013EEF47F|nr:efflux RND transporter periplasmic adaptor subunit [Bacilliculturomica massiliensis]